MADLTESYSYHSYQNSYSCCSSNFLHPKYDRLIYSKCTLVVYNQVTEMLGNLYGGGHYIRIEIGLQLMLN